MRISLKTTSPHDDTEGSCYAFIIEIDKVAAVRLIRRKLAFKTARDLDHDLDEMYYKDYDGKYYEMNPETREAVGDPQRMDWSRCIVRKSGVSWTAIPYNDTATVLMDDLPWDEIEEIANTP